jgi:hypothetical protein
LQTAHLLGGQIGRITSTLNTKGENTMATFKPEVNYDNLIKHETSCGNQTCKVQLDSTNYGEKIDESKGYAPASSFFLACYGFFCNTCAPLAVEFYQDK